MEMVDSFQRLPWLGGHGVMVGLFQERVLWYQPEIQRRPSGSRAEELNTHAHTHKHTHTPTPLTFALSALAVGFVPIVTLDVGGAGMVAVMVYVTVLFLALSIIYQTSAYLSYDLGRLTF